MRQNQGFGQSQGQDKNQTRWAGKRILFVSGKGGVGKSLVAAAIAQEEARSGRRVLLAEVGDTSYYKDFWNLASVGHNPTKTAFGFDLALWDGESCLREYVLYYLRMERLYKLFFENKVMRALVGVAPGLNEIAILGKITSGVRKIGPPMDYDLVVVDCYSTGHALALLETPRGMQEAIKFGPMGSNSREINNVLKDERVCGYIAVTLLEELPVVETLEFRDQLRKDLGVDVEIIANKVLEAPVGDEDLSRLTEQDPKGLGEFARYLHVILDRQKSFSEMLKKSVNHLTQVPLIFSAEAKKLVDGAGEALR
jgi:anion-transporting  ArsA/GET3 family ATPase